MRVHNSIEREFLTESFAMMQNTRYYDFSGIIFLHFDYMQMILPISCISTLNKLNKS